MAESIKFRQGVSRLQDAPLEAPWDLRNAEIKPSHIVSALDGTSVASGIPDAGVNREFIKHAGGWIYGQTYLRYRSLLYTSDLSDKKIDVYPPNNPNQEDDFARILNINMREGANRSYTGGADKDSENPDVDRVPRLITYAFVPLNSRNEAGIWRYQSYKTSEFLPVIEISGTKQLEYLEVYRTAEMKQDISGSAGPVQSLHYLGRYSAGDSDSENRWTAMPSGVIYESGRGETPKSYIENDTVSYIYLSSSDYATSGSSIVNLGEVSNSEFIDVDLNGWRVIFEDLLIDGSNLSTGTEYFVRSFGPKSLTLEDASGNKLSFDPTAVVQYDFVNNFNQLENVETVAVKLLPPEGIDDATSDFTILDGKVWVWDQIGEDNEQSLKPTSRSLERDRTLHGRTEIQKSATGQDNLNGDRFVISGEDASDVYEEGDIVTFEPDTSTITVVSASSEIEFTGTATLTVESGGNVVVVLERTRKKANGDVSFTYSIDAGSPNFTVELQSGPRVGGGSFGTITSKSVSSTGEDTITDTDPSEGFVNYRIKVTDSNNDTDTTREVLVDNNIDVGF